MDHSADDHRDNGGLRSVRLLRPYGGWLVLVLTLLILLTFADMAAPFFLKLLIDDVFPHGDSGGQWQLLWLILPGIVVVYVARNALFFISRMRALRISEDLCFELRKRLFEHLQRLSLRFYRTNRPGQVSARLMDDTFKIQTFIQDKLPTLLRYTLEFVVLVVIIYQVNWLLALIASVVLPFHFWTYLRFRRPIRQSSSEAQESLAIVHGNIVERFLGMEVVKGFSAEERETITFKEAIDASRKSKIKSQRYHFSQKVAADLLVGAGTVALIWFGAMEVKKGVAQGGMSGGAFLMFFMYVKMLYPAVLEMISGFGHLSKASACVDRVFEMLDEPAREESLRGDGTIELTELAGRIEYRDVSFAYEDGPRVLDRVNLTIEPGEHVAITGPSGSGKSTLISLLPCFNDPTSGTVSIDGRPVETISIRTLRGLFGIAFQEVFLFNAPIAENLRYARPEATSEEMVEACRITGADEFIQRLPEGYATRIGGSGGELSRGEKQRITLARALLRNPRVLIIDEATASIDAPAAREIVDSMLTLMEGRTVIMVTHDTELLDLVDRVVSLEEGSIAYNGPPEGFELPESASPFRNGSPGRASGIIEPRTARARGSSLGPLFHETEPPAPVKKRSTRPFGGGLVGALLLCLTIVGGCMRSTTTTSSIEMEDPRLSQGLLIDEPDPVKLGMIAEALDAIALNPDDIVDPADGGSAAQDAPPPEAPPQEAPPQDAPPVEAATPPAAGEGAGAEPPRLTVQEARDMVAVQQVPADAAKLVTLPKLSDTEIAELLARLSLRLGAERGYAPAGSVLVDALPVPPEGVIDTHMLARGEGESTHLVRLGFRRYITQPPQVWAMAVTLAADGSLSVNADLALIEPAIGEMIASLNEMRAGLMAGDLEAQLIQLSYVVAPTALSILKGMGVTTYNEPTEIPQTVSFDQLPYVVAIPEPSAADVGLIGAAELSGGSLQLSLTPNVASQLSQNNIASPLTQVLVMYHPAHPEQFSRVRRLLDEYIDRPARQIFVEGMVLEISEQGLRDLGIEWELDQPPVLFRAGSLSAEGVTDTLTFETTDIDFHRVFTRDFPWVFSLKLRTLIREGKAEILSRPSVLTLNNRQSTIRVGQDIPIAMSQEGILGASNKIAFQFKYLPVGILLNIRPRINEDGSEVSMLIDTIVSAVVPGEDLEIRSLDGELLASAPTVSTRRVQTYSRIGNNTPLIIGGLVSRERTTAQDKIPLLGDLPLIGAAFRAERTETLKREVIIVLTPFVLPEEKLIPRSLPKDEDYFDSFDHELFRDSYRIRTDDVFDLTFLFENQRLNRYRSLADQAIDRNFRLVETEPFRSFAGDRIPGEDILVTRMIYEVIKRLDLADRVEFSRAIYFQSQQVGGYNVRFLERTMAALANGMSASAFFRNLQGKALAITYYYDRTSLQAGRLASEPIPDISLVDCPDRDRWGEMLWELNQIDEDGRQRYTILIQGETDIVRLRRALTLKRIVTLNGGDEQLLLRNFSVGKVLLMPELKGNQVHVIDAEVAKYFFHTEHYYAALIGEIEKRLTELDEALRRPEIRVLLQEAAMDAGAATPAGESGQ